MLKNGLKYCHENECYSCLSFYTLFECPRACFSFAAEKAVATLTTVMRERRLWWHVPSLYILTQSSLCTLLEGRAMFKSNWNTGVWTRGISCLLYSIHSDGFLDLPERKSSCVWFTTLCFISEHEKKNTDSIVSIATGMRHVVLLCWKKVNSLNV